MPIKKTVEQTLALFKTFVMEDRKDLPWLKGRQGMLDCAAAVSYITERKPEIISCTAYVNKLKTEKRWQTRYRIPVPGNLVFFDWTGHEFTTGNVDHVGIVVSATHDKVSYISADSTQPLPGKVTINPGVGYHWIAGFGTVDYATTPPKTTKEPVK
jgi:hypothetical protein